MAVWRKMATFTRITVNGQTYNSVDDMPPDVRRQYEQVMQRLREDRDGNGVPDILEGKSPDNNVVANFTRTEKVIVNGKEYASVADVPPEFRQIIERASNDAPGQVAYATPTRDDLLNRRAMTMSEEPGGITIRLSWGTILGVALVLAAIGFGILWYLRH